jgi:hypothetical protein
MFAAVLSVAPLCLTGVEIRLKGVVTATLTCFLTKTLSAQAHRPFFTLLFFRLDK